MQLSNQSSSSLVINPNGTNLEGSMITGRLPDVLDFIEREEKLFLPVSVLEEFVELELLESKLITQWYFPKEHYVIGKLALEKFAEEQGVDIDDLNISQVRLRRIQSDQDESYSIDLKGKLPSCESNERFELPPFQLSKEIFNELLLYATDGMIHKRRYFLEGEIYLPNGDVKAHTAEIDLILEAGEDGKKIVSNKHRFVLVDVEFDRREDVELFRAGEHSFEFLDHAINVTTAEAGIRKALSMKRMSRGIEKVHRDVIREISKSCKRLFAQAA